MFATTLTEVKKNETKLNRYLLSLFLNKFLSNTPTKSQKLKQASELNIMKQYLDNNNSNTHHHHSQAN